MYTVLSGYKDENGVYYALRNSSEGFEIEVVAEADLILLILCDLSAVDMNGKKVTVQGGKLDMSVTFMDILDVDEDTEEEDEWEDYDDTNFGVDEETDDSIGDDIDYSDYDYEDDVFEEDSSPEGSVVSKLYALLNEKQIEVIKRYYIWFSQRLFEDSNKGASMQFKSAARKLKKQNDLKQLRGSAQWRYAGFVDTGSVRYGYTCTLGHPLRYMHLAWNIEVGDIETSFFGEDYDFDVEKVISSNGCIVFGIKCIGDFFDVDDECIRNLQRTQRDSLSDMATMYEFYQNGVVAEAIDSFNIMDAIVSKINLSDNKRKMLNADYKPVIPQSMVAFYKQFRACGLIPPKSLVQSIRSCILGWTDGQKYFSNKWTGYLKEPDKSFYDNVKGLFSNKTKVRDNYFLILSCLRLNKSCLSVSGATGVGWKFLYTFFVCELCGVYKYDADQNKDEGGKSKVVKYALKQLYNGNSHKIFADFEYTWGYGSKLLDMLMQFSVSRSVVNKETGQEYYFDRFGFYRSSFIEKAKEFSSQTGNSFMADVDFYYALEHYLYYSTDRTLNQYPELRVNGGVSLDLAYKKLKEVIGRLDSEIEEFTDWQVQQLEKSNDIKVPDTVEGLVEFLYEADKTGVGSDFTFHLSVLNTVHGSGKLPSVKQLYYLKQLYHTLTGLDFVSGELDNTWYEKDHGDVFEACKKVLSDDTLLEKAYNAMEGNHVRQETFKSVLESILKYKKISEKQQRYALAAKSVI